MELGVVIDALPGGLGNIAHRFAHTDELLCIVENSTLAVPGAPEAAVVGVPVRVDDINVNQTVLFSVLANPIPIVRLEQLNIPERLQYLLGGLEVLALVGRVNVPREEIDTLDLGKEVRQGNRGIAKLNAELKTRFSGNGKPLNNVVSRSLSGFTSFLGRYSGMGRTSVL